MVTPRSTRRSGIAISILCSCVLLAACGDDDATGPAPGDPPEDPNTVLIGDNFFNPGTRTVESGATVVWVNEGAALHNTVSNDGLWASGELNQGATFQHAFATTGTFTYSCTLHPGMNGTIVVQ